MTIYQACAMICTMIERLSRKVERAIAIGLISAAAVGGYAVGEHGSSHDVAAAKPKVVATGRPTPNRHPVKPTATKATPKSTALTKAEMPVPLTPTGGEYNTAAKAVADVYGGGDVPSAEALLNTIQNPEIKAQTNHAIQEAIAAQAMSDVYGGGGVPSAEALLGQITLPDIKPKAQEAVSTAIAYQAASDAYGGGDIASAKALEADITDPNLGALVNTMIHEVQSGNSNGASNTWNQLSNEASDQYNGISSSIADEYSQLERHTDSYLQQYDQAK